jgi:acetoacetate decarboxylase
MPSTNTVYNDNMACVNWSKCTTTKGMRHIQIKENRVRESILTNFVIIKHIDGKINLADIFTKEMRDVCHFVELRDLFMWSRFGT